MSRADAKAAGLKRYFTGVACKRGHVAERNVTGANCIKCGLLRQKEKYASDLKFKSERDSLNARNKRKRGTEYLEKENARYHSDYATNPEYRLKRIAQKKEKYATDPEYRLKRLNLSKRLRAARRRKNQAILAAKIVAELRAAHDRRIAELAATKG